MSNSPVIIQLFSWIFHEINQPAIGVPPWQSIGFPAGSRPMGHGHQLVAHHLGRCDEIRCKLHGKKVDEQNWSWNLWRSKEKSSTRRCFLMDLQKVFHQRWNNRFLQREIVSSPKSSCKTTGWERSSFGIQLWPWILFENWIIPAGTVYSYGRSPSFDSSIIAYHHKSFINMPLSIANCSITRGQLDCGRTRSRLQPLFDAATDVSRPGVKPWWVNPGKISAVRGNGL